MARTDAIVLGAGIVGISAALHLVKRGLSVALVDRRGPGEETSFGNAGVIEGNTLFAHAFPKGLGALLRIALKQAPEANYHLVGSAGPCAVAAGLSRQHPGRTRTRFRQRRCGRFMRGPSPSTRR